MILFSDSADLLKIVQKAVEYMHTKGYSQDFYIQSIVWNDEEYYWVVRFYCETGSFENEFVVVETVLGEYIVTGTTTED